MALVFVLLLCGGLLAGECYDAQKIWLVVRVGGKADVFETKSGWVRSGHSIGDFARDDVTWFARNAEGVLTDDELLALVGQDDLARRLAAERQSLRRRSTIQLVVGVPLGAAMMVGSIWWGRRIWSTEVPSTVDIAGAVVMGTAGIGVIIGALSSYIRHHSPPKPNQHEISIKQAVELVDRHNTALMYRCQSVKSGDMPNGR